MNPDPIAFVYYCGYCVCRIVTKRTPLLVQFQDCCGRANRRVDIAHILRVDAGDNSWRAPQAGAEVDGMKLGWLVSVVRGQCARE
jgi:hypothetical protein